MILFLSVGNGHNKNSKILTADHHGATITQDLKEEPFTFVLRVSKIFRNISKQIETQRF